MAGQPTVPAVVVESNPPPKRLDELKVKTWEIWTKEPSTFDWHYDEQEVCYFLAGDVTVKTPQGDVQIRAGDLVTFPVGLSCTWHVKKAVRKHYKFG
jgi:uncharacterized cupin superfamily protein